MPHPSNPTPTTPISQREFWVAAYLTALARVPPSQPLAEADEALRICNDRWSAEVRRPSLGVPSTRPLGSFGD